MREETDEAIVTRYRTSGEPELSKPVRTRFTRELIHGAFLR